LQELQACEHACRCRCVCNLKEIELDARAEGVLRVCDHFTSVSALKDFIRSCLRAEAIKSVAARGDKIGYAHGQANNFLITKRL